MESFIQQELIKYIIDEKLIKSIIYVESGRNFYVRSNFNAIALMQIKVSSAGKIVYQDLVKKGNPSNK
ncbi:transglycosylase SLT domain-containing protein [Buchnera aphidicola (Hormaphis cornu)]|nr:transglycosylase SLT domain-containing protein [Buchnera aphidicola (Hormaphis cornu)]